MSTDDFDPRPAPRWDERRPRRAPFIEWLPFQTLNKPWKIKAALRAGAGAYVAIAVSHGFSAFAAWISYVRRDTLLFGYDKTAVITANLVVGTLALALYVITRRSPSRPLLYFVLAWSVIELFPPLTYGLYGHGAGSFISFFGLAVAITGLQGIQAKIRKSEGLPASS